MHPLIICRIDRSKVYFVRVHIRKKMYTFDWDSTLPAEEQYANILALVINSLREEAPAHSIEVVNGPYPLPDSFEHEGVMYHVEVKRK